MSARSIWDLEDPKEDSHPIIERSHTTVDLHPCVIRGYRACRLSKPSAIQAEILCRLKNNSYENLVVCASSRTGKTTAVITGILDAYLKPFNQHSMSIILCPTYDIAELTYLSCQNLAEFCENVAVYFVAKGKTINSGRPKKKEIIVGTPDKISEYTRSSVIKLATVAFLVIDDADCLGNPKKYLGDCKQMFEKLAIRCRTVLCTVSLTGDIKKFIDEFIYAPEKLILDDFNFRVYPLKQIYLIYDTDESKEDSLVYVIKMKPYPGKVVIFVETKENIANVGMLLHNRGIVSNSLTGQMSNPQKKKVLEDFVSGAVRVLVTTRSFVSVIPSVGIGTTKLVNFDQVLDKKSKLETEVYKRRECLIDRCKKGVVVSFVEAKWKNFLFKDKHELDNREFYNEAEIITSDNLKAYFS